MAFKKILRRSLSRGKEGTSMSTKVPKGYLAVYVGEEQKRGFIVPVSCLNEPEFQELLRRAEEDLGLIIRWVVSQFLAAKISSSISLLALYHDVFPLCTWSRRFPYHVRITNDSTSKPTQLAAEAKLQPGEKSKEQ
ncbi:uncharacterized protein LOC114723622 [Neltuma alba]|uniref:uncharacterized protein LOC114723622 n=1 Tax=Neltuma alba TaxID=207710 RepID=UPI0010A3AE35|nr:uncharacterized protein LOC114723622 [Prosopis alba]